MAFVEFESMEAECGFFVLLAEDWDRGPGGNGEFGGTTYFVEEGGEFGM